MTVYQWSGIGDYDYLIRLSEEEVEVAAQMLPRSKCLFENYYYFVNVERQRIAAPPCMALLLGVGNTSGPLYSVTDDQLDLQELLQFEGEVFPLPDH